MPAILDGGKEYVFVESTLQNPDKPDPEIEKKWITESEARYAAYQRGELEAYDWAGLEHQHIEKKSSEKK